MNKLVGAGDVRRSETRKGESGGGRSGRATAEEKLRTSPIYNPATPSPPPRRPPSNVGEAMGGARGERSDEDAEDGL